MKSGIFNNDFYPTPVEIIEKMVDGIELHGKTILEPSAGKGDIVDYLKSFNANVIACEKSPELREILKNKCPIIENDFLQLKAEQISHIQAIIMNPPFSADERHIIHAWSIAPDGCRIVALCNSETLNKCGWRSREELRTIVDSYGYSLRLGQCFSDAERKTDVEVSLISLFKPGNNAVNEFEGFFLDEDPAEQQDNAIMKHSVVRELVNRYVEAVKIFDEQLETAQKMNRMISSFYSSGIAMTLTKDAAPMKRNEFKKDLQKSAWNYVFRELDMQKYATSGLRADINKFVEQQTQIPFTMRNIYRMLEIVVGTQDQRMDKALLEVFVKVTQRYSENRFNLEGWKTNSHYLLNRKFILPNVVDLDYRGRLRTNYHGWADPVDDLDKALCHFLGVEYNQRISFGHFLSEHNVKAGEFHTWGFFDFRAYKKGTVHFTFQDENVWMKFNQRIAKILGYPLPESMNPKNTAKESPIADPEEVVENTIHEVLALPAHIENIEPDTEEPEDVFETIEISENQLALF